MMTTNFWRKSSKVLVTPCLGSKGVTLRHRENNNIVQLDPQQAELWALWPKGSSLNTMNNCFEALCSGNFLLSVGSFGVVSYQETPFDELKPSVPKSKIKWYQETSDLTILFNSERMNQNNPLLALGPYDSLIWNGIIHKCTVGQIRREVLRVFGYDKVIVFLARLYSMGMILMNTDIPFLSSDESTIEEFPAPYVQWNLFHSRIPWYCLWEVNTVCDLSCKICYLPQVNSNGPTLEQAQEIVQQLIDAEVFYVCIMGGESLLRKDLEIIIRKLRCAGIFVKIITNGQRLTQERIKSLSNAGINLIEVSFDGLQATTHDESRGNGSFQKAIEAVKQLKVSSIPRVAIVWTLHSGNSNDFEMLPNFMQSLGIKECYISQFKKTGKKGSIANYDPMTYEWIQSAHGKLQEWRDTYPELSITLMPGCTCARTSVVIGYNGNVRTCSFSYDSVIGNVYEKSFKTIWMSIADTIPETGPIGYCNTKLLRPGI